MHEKVMRLLCEQAAAKNAAHAAKRSKEAADWQLVGANERVEHAMWMLRLQAQADAGIEFTDPCEAEILAHWKATP